MTRRNLVWTLELLDLDSELGWAELKLTSHCADNERTVVLYKDVFLELNLDLGVVMLDKETPE